MVTEIAYFTPKTKSGSAMLLDFWNADLWDGDSHLSACDSSDQIQFRTSETTWLHGHDAGATNGAIQAYFAVESADYYLLVAKLSSSDAEVSIYVDGNYVDSFSVQGNGEEIPVTLHLPAGNHTITIVQKPIFDFWFYVDYGDPLWFHSITAFQI